MPCRHTIRTQWHDYNAGSYFITICTKKQQHYFGHITCENSNPKIILSTIGSYAERYLQSIQHHFPDIQIPLYSIMPNHIHALVFISGNFSLKEKRNQAKSPPYNIQMHYANATAQKGRLSTVIGSYKAAITKYAYQNNITFAWQTRLFEHIIKHQEEYNAIAEYIQNNVARWYLDKYYKQ